MNRAKDMILTGREVKGEEGYNWGLVNRLCDEKNTVLQEAINLCENIIQNPQMCMKLDRLNLIENTFGDL